MTKVGFAVKIIFQLTQHSRDGQLMLDLMEYLDCGYICKKEDTLDYRVTKFADVESKIIPLFKQYPILGIKYKDFKDICRAVDIMKDKGHLTNEGLNKIIQIKAGINKGREYNS
jgi:transcription initiation factor TFIID subunit TAF12